MIELQQDVFASLRQAARRLARAPGFSAVTILTLGLGIGACTAIYTVVYGVLLRPLPYSEPDRLVHLWQVNKAGRQHSFSDPNFEDVRDRSRSFAALAEYGQWTTSVVGGSTPARVKVASVSGPFFATFATQPVIGRGFLPEERRAGGAPAVLVSYGFWRQMLGSARDLSSRTLSFDRRSYTVVGVLPPGFDFPAGVDLWTPRELEQRYPSRTAHNWRVVGRLASGVTLAQARDDVHAIAVRLKRELGESTWMVDAAVVGLRDELTGETRPVLLMLLGAVAFLLFVAAANVVNLLLARSAARQREAAVRAALGASPGRQLAPFLAESGLLVTAGSALGLVAAALATRALIALGPSNIPRLNEVRLGWPVLAVACAVSTAIALALGLFAGWRAMRLNPQGWLQEGQLASVGGGSGARVRDGLVVVQLALSMMLLVGAGLLARSFVRLLLQDPGFRTTHLLTMDLSSPPAEDAASAARLVRFHDELVARTRAIHGVVDASGVNALPMTGTGADGMFLIVDGAPPATMEEFRQLSQNKANVGMAEFRAASDGYFKTMGIPLVRGRWFDARDAPDAPHVAVISQSLVRTRWPDRDPIGLRIEYGNMDGDIRLLTIVGIVGDVRHRGPDAKPDPTLYVNARQRPRTTADYTLVVHTTGNPAALATQVREIARALDPDVPPRLRTIEQVFSSSLANRRYSLWLVAAFALAALGLAVIGIYGVVSYGVAQRTRELGLRVALGARPAQVVGLVLAHGTKLVVAGLVIGGIGALLLTRFMQTMLFEIAPTDPITYALVSATLAIAALVACQIPAVRAARVDPLVALRTDM